jgi:hypothetical protein
MLAANPELGMSEIREIIKLTSDQLEQPAGSYDASGHSPFFGYGRLNAGKAVQQALAARQTALPAFQVNGLAYLAGKTNQVIKDGEMPPGSRMIGFQLNLSPVHPGLSIQYRAYTSAPGTPALLNAGEFAGTPDRRRKLTGFNLALTGALSGEYDICYQAAFEGNSRSPEMKNGTLCGVDKPSGKGISCMWIRVVRKS